MLGGLYVTEGVALFFPSKNLPTISASLGKALHDWPPLGPLLVAFWVAFLWHCWHEGR